jgi:hypothetical protein
MNRIKFAFPITLTLMAVTAAAQYSIDWWKVAGGGGATGGGGYALNATIGQHDAGSMSGGQFTLIGGFWAITLVQTTNSPTPALTIASAGPGQANLSWSPDIPGFHLQMSDSLSPPIWIDALSGTNHPITIPTTKPMKFYRLINP